MSANNRVTFNRSHGTRHIPTANGELITSVSLPSWERFIHAIGGLAQQSVGRFITTPELVTLTDISLDKLSERQVLIESRIADARDATRQFPASTLLLATVAFDQTVEKPRNAVMFLQDGAEVGRTYKIEPVVHQEREFLHYSPEPNNVVKPAANTLAVICSDLLGPPPIDDKTETLLVSACWGVPSAYPGNRNLPPASDERQVRFFEGIIDDLFEQHPNLTTVLMTDRALEENIVGPFNFVATR